MPELDRDGLPTIPMFDDLERQPPPKKARTRSPRSVEWHVCPSCRQTVGCYWTDRQNSRVAFRKHWRTRNTGERFACSTSDTEYTPPPLGGISL